MYRPHESFLERLKELDPRLGAFFNAKAGLVIITYSQPVGPPANLMQVKNDDGSFRIPDDRVIDHLKQHDNNNHSVAKRLERNAKHYLDLQHKKRESVHNEIRDRTADDKYQLRRAFARKMDPGGKAARHVRRITPKPKGKVF